MNSSIAVRLLLASALPATALAAPVTTHKTQTNVSTEITLVAQRDYKDPFNELTLDVVFQDPLGQSRKVPAFWTGGSRWKARYASPVAGIHTWWSQCSDARDAGLHGVKGAITVTLYEGDNPLYRHGPIRVSSNSRRFEHADDTHFFWLGDTWWMGLCHRLKWPEDFQRLAADRREKGFTVIQLVAGLYPDMHPFDPRGANEAGFPWQKDYERISPEYFDAADQRLGHLVDQGLIPCIVGAWGYYLPWMGEAKAKAHWRNLIARYGAWPVVWCAAGEANLPWYRAEKFPYDDQATARRWCDLMRFIRITDPWRRPLTIHPTAIHSFSARHVVDDESLLDFDFLQTPHDGPGESVEVAAVRTVVQSRAAFPTRPVVNGEASYEMLGDRIPASKTRAMFWLCLLNGAAGHTYGANGIWQVNRKGEPHGPSPTAGSPPEGYGKIAWDEAMVLPGARQVAAGKAWLLQHGWHELAPHYSWAAWADSPAPSEVLPCAVGQTDGCRLLYMLRPGPVLVRQLEPGRVYRVAHFDPESAVESDGGTLTADHQGMVRIEAPPHDHDWVVALEPQ